VKVTGRQDLTERRQDDRESGAALGPVLGSDIAAHALDDVVADRQAEAGALAGRLGGEERLEQARQDLGGNAWPIILDGQHRAPARRGGHNTEHDVSQASG
jgi:hypothetical protein